MNYLANNVLILIHLHLDITIGHNINTLGWIENSIFQDIYILHTILMMLNGGMVTQGIAYFGPIGVRLFTSNSYLSSCNYKGIVSIVQEKQHNTLGYREDRDTL